MSARRRSRSRGPVVVLVVLVLLAVLLVVADRVAVGVAERRVSQRLQTELGTAAAPDVSIEGFPFLTQVLHKRLSSVHLVADDVQPPGETTALSHVDLRLHGVTSPDRLQTFTAARTDGTARIDYATARTLTGQQLAYATDGRVQLTAQTELLSLPVTAQVVGRPVVDTAAQTLTLGDPAVTVAGVPVPASTSQALLDTVVKPAPITGVPYGLRVTGITARPEGLDAAVVGENTTFRR